MSRDSLPPKTRGADSEAQAAKQLVQVLLVIVSALNDDLLRLKAQDVRVTDSPRENRLQNCVNVGNFVDSLNVLRALDACIPQGILPCLRILPVHYPFGFGCWKGRRETVEFGIP